MCLETLSLRIYSHKTSNNLRSHSIFQALTKLVQGNQLFHLEMLTKISSLLDPQYHRQKPFRSTSLLLSRTRVISQTFSRVLPNQTILHQRSVIFSNLRQMDFSSKHRIPLLQLHNFRRQLQLTRFKISKYRSLARSSNRSLLNLDLMPLPLLLVKLKLHRFRVSKLIRILLSPVYQIFLASSQVRFKQASTVCRSSINSSSPEH